MNVTESTSCCGGTAVESIRSVLSVDRTFNVSTLFATVTVFKHKAVVRKNSGDFPLFLGPVMLHGDGQFGTYHHFFSHLSGLMADNAPTTEMRVSESVVTGSDEEKALVKAMKLAFPNSKHLFCMLHCKENVRHYLTKTGVAQDMREKLLSMLFGSGGATSAGDEKQLEDQLAEVMQKVRMSNLDHITNYLQDKIFPKIVSNCNLMWQEKWIGQQMWSNNNCESINHLLKVAIDWKPQRVRALVDHIRDIVRLQYNDVKRALCGQGEFQLTPLFIKHYIPFVKWSGGSEERREQLFRAFMSDSGVRRSDNTVTSSDGQLTVQGNNKVARKCKQAQRPRGHRTGRKQV